MISGFGGGAIFPLFAAMTADYFGENYNATNYGQVYRSKVCPAGSGSAWGRSWWPRGVTAPRSCWPVRSAWGPAESVVVTRLARKQLAAVGGGDLGDRLGQDVDMVGGGIRARALPGRSVTASNSVVLSHQIPIGW